MNSILGMIGSAIGGVVSLICLYELFSEVSMIYYDFDRFWPLALGLAVVGFSAGGVIAALHEGRFNFFHCCKLIGQAVFGVVLIMLIMNFANELFINFNRKDLYTLTSIFAIGGTTLASIQALSYWAFSNMISSKD